MPEMPRCSSLPVPTRNAAHLLLFLRRLGCCVLVAQAGALLEAQSTAVPAAAGSPPAARYQDAFAEPPRVDQGAAALWQSLQKLKTRASLMMVTAHPDDEDGGMLSFESRARGVDLTLLTLNRGEGGQNVMSSDYFDQMGVLRTQELLAAGQYYGVHQYFTRVIDFGFSKTIDETLKNWGHDRVLSDSVRAVRMARPLVVTSVFAGNVSDGHGHHQVAGLMAQEVYKAAGDPAMFPEQIAAGLLPWSPLKVYARVPFARVTEKGIYDYATGHWEPVRFRNYVTGTWIEGMPSATVEIPEGTYQPLFGTSYLAVAREGLNQQKSQNGGIGAPPRGPVSSPYHLYASRLPGAATTLPAHESDFFEGIDVSLAGIADYAPAADRATWRKQLSALSATVEEATGAFRAADPGKSAPALAHGLAQTEALLQALGTSGLPAEAVYNMRHELEIKRAQFDSALGQSLGMNLLATVTAGASKSRPGPAGDLGGSDAAYATTIAGQSVFVDVHVADQGTLPVTDVHTELHAGAAGSWVFQAQGTATTAELKAGTAQDVIIGTRTPVDAALTRPYFTRPNHGQPFYNLVDPQYLNLPNMPYTLNAETTYRYGGVQAHLRGVVQTTHRFVGPGPLPEPLLTAPAISLTLSPEAGIVPLGSHSLELAATVHSSVKGPAQGTVRLDLPPGWSAEPAAAPWNTANDGDDRTVRFHVMPSTVAAQPYQITAVAEYNGEQFRQGFQTVGYVGLRPYPFYRESVYRTTGVDVKIAPGLRVGYVAGTGDEVAQSLENLGVHVTYLSPSDLSSGDLSSFSTIVLGIRAYAARPELQTANARLLNYARAGGVVVVQYQTAEFDHDFGPYPLSVPGDAEKVVEEDSAVTLPLPADPLLNWPNKITTADFTGWVEERGHGFPRTWDPHYRALTEMHDAGQEPQHGGLLYTPFGQGAYVYMAFAFFREMPDGVPGSFRLMANLLSLGKNPGLHAGAAQVDPAAQASPAAQVVPAAQAGRK